MRLFKPTWLVKDVMQITPESLVRQGIQAILLDLDNTFISITDEDNTPMEQWVNRIMAKNIRVVIVSNNTTAHVSRHLKNKHIPFIANAKKPLASGLKRAITVTGIDNQGIAVIGDQLLTDIIGGNRLGLRTIMVKPRSHTDKWFTVLSRQLEKYVLIGLKKYYHITWQETLD